MKIPFSSKKTLDKVHDHGESSSGDHKTSASGSKRENAMVALDFTIEFVEQVTELVPFDMAKSVLKGITTILILLSKNFKNKDSLRELANRCQKIGFALKQATKDVSVDDISDALKDALQVLESSIHNLLSKVEVAVQHGSARKFFGANLDEEKIGEWSKKLDRSLSDFGLSVNLDSNIYSHKTYMLLKHSEATGLRPDPPPAPPSMFFGREEIFAQVKEALLQDEDVVLIGPGGIGKSTIAKALINDQDVLKRYGRRFFVSYSGMDPVTMTSGSFVDRIADVLGLPLLGVQNKGQMLSNLALSPVLVVLDNAETFEDAADRDAANEISSLVAEIANTRGVTVLLTSRTSRNARDVSWTEFNVPPLGKLPARQYFRKIFHGDITDDSIDELLAVLDFHPLSIHILAYAAKESRWTGEELCEEWSTQKSRLLQTGDKEDLGFTIRLSLSSPSVKNLGDVAQNVLWIIAFFPQGINRKHAAHLFPSIPNISSLVDTLCKVSLVLRSGSFWTTLAPIRMFLLDAFPNTGLELLSDIRLMYYDSLKATSEENSYADLITSDHLNMEHLIGYELANARDNIQNTRACFYFLSRLRVHKLRPTSLGPIISSLSETSHDEREAKAWCLGALGHIYFALSNDASTISAYLAACPLFVALGDHGMAASCVANTAVTYTNRGSFLQAKQLLEDFIRSPSWSHIDEQDRTEIYYEVDVYGMYTTREGADELFLRSMEDPGRGLDSRLHHWEAKMYHGYITPEEAEKQIGSLRSHYMSTSYQWRFQGAMADAAFLQRKFDIASELLKQAHDDAVDARNPHGALQVLCRQATVGSVQGNYQLARSLLQHALDALSVVATPLSGTFLEMRHAHARNELYAKNYSEAHRLLVDVVADCDIQGNMSTKTRCTRALGEVAILLGRPSDSDHYFAQTVELCGEAGVPLELLDVCEPMLRYDDDEFPGWRAYLRAQAGQAIDLRL